MKTAEIGTDLLEAAQQICLHEAVLFHGNVASWRNTQDFEPGLFITAGVLGNVSTLRIKVDSAVMGLVDNGTEASLFVDREKARNLLRDDPFAMMIYEAFQNYRLGRANALAHGLTIAEGR